MDKNKIKECLNNGLIKHNKSNIYLTDEDTNIILSVEYQRIIDRN